MKSCDFEAEGDVFTFRGSSATGTTFVVIVESSDGTQVGVLNPRSAVRNIVVRKTSLRQTWFERGWKLV